MVVREIRISEDKVVTNCFAFVGKRWGWGLLVFLGLIGLGVLFMQRRRGVVEGVGCALFGEYFDGRI